MQHMIQYIDTHFHAEMIQERGFHVCALFSELAESGFLGGIDIGIHPEDIPGRRRLLQDICGLTHLLFSGGIYPGILDDGESGKGRDRNRDIDQLLLLLEQAAADKKIQCIGEFGLDYHWDYGMRKAQQELCIRQIELANTCRLPIIIHNREADEDMAELLQRNPAEYGGIIHCFSSDRKAAERFLDAGMHISFAGNLTFRNSRIIQEAASYVPENRILIETDAPYLAPHPYRGKTNHPGYIPHTYAYAAQLRKCTAEDLADQILVNFTSLFSVQ